MSNFSIPSQLIQIFKGGNPQQAIIGMLQQNSKGNPMMENVMSMMNNKDSAGLEQIARNLCRSKNLDADALYKQISEQFK